MKKSGRYHLNEIIKVNNIGTNQQHVSPHKAQNGRNTTSVGFLPEVHHLNLIMIKHLLLLLSRFSCVQLCAIQRRQPTRPSPSLGFSRQENWSGLPFPFPVHKSEKKVKSLSRVRLFATPWTAALQAPPSMGFSRQEYWSGVPSPSLDKTFR